VDVQRVETYEEHLAATEVVWEAFAVPEDRRARQLTHLRVEFEAARAAAVPITFLAYVDGRPAGVGRSIYSDRGVFLIAGAVAEWARGRGVYRALVHARWDDAVARGTPALVTEALPNTSYPILKRVGFVDVCTIRRLEDPRSR
jgi:predicted GNAT superfamily acetyltransferase